MYYRLATWYFRYEKKSNISYGATALVSLSQIFILLDIGGTIFLLNYSRSERIMLFKKYLPFYITFLIIVTFVNDFIFRNEYDKYDQKWKNESENERTMHGIIIALFIIIPLIYMPIILNIFDFTA
jgi:purine-cytosine permease-like protein